MDTIEATIDTVEGTLDTLERIPKVNLNGTTKNQQIVILSTVAGISLVTGVAAGFVWAKKKYQSELPYVKGEFLS